MVSWAGKGDLPRHERPRRDATVLECVECGKRSHSAVGWRGVRVDLAEEGDEPAVAFYCPECAAHELS
jgi:ribosomal protein L44E